MLSSFSVLYLPSRTFTFGGIYVVEGLTGLRRGKRKSMGTTCWWDIALPGTLLLFYSLPVSSLSFPSVSFWGIVSADR